MLVSPGPGTPDDAGASTDVIRRCAAVGRPMLGVCLGHQALGAVHGAVVERAPELRHGKTSLVHHEGAGVLAGLRTPFTATRYHSLTVRPDTLPAALEPTGWTDDGVLMAMRHRELPLEGVQFHPESVLTEDGHRLLATWMDACGHPVDEDSCAASPRASARWPSPPPRPPDTAPEHRARRQLPKMPNPPPPAFPDAAGRSRRWPERRRPPGSWRPRRPGCPRSGSGVRILPTCDGSDTLLRGLRDRAGEAGLRQGAARPPTGSARRPRGPSPCCPRETSSVTLELRDTVAPAPGEVSTTVPGRPPSSTSATVTRSPTPSSVRRRRSAGPDRRRRARAASRAGGRWSAAPACPGQELPGRRVLGEHAADLVRVVDLPLLGHRGEAQPEPLHGWPGPRWRSALQSAAPGRGRDRARRAARRRCPAGPRCPRSGWW